MNIKPIYCPKVSVIIPTYNRSHFIKDALESVLAQSYQDFELIIIDDGSTDNTSEILADYSDRLQYIYQKNQGRSVARNLGVKKAKGHYIAFLDSDDLWLSNKLEKQIQFLETNSQISLVHCFTAVVDENRKHCDELTKFHKIHHQRSFKRGYDYEDISLECIMFTSCIIVKRDIFLKLGGFDNNCEPLEDWDLYLRLAFKHKIAVVPEILSLYRHHNSQSGNYSLTKARIQVSKKQLKLLKMNTNQLCLKLAFRNFAIHLGESYFILDKYVEAQRWLRQAIKSDPSLAFRSIWGQHWLLPHLLIASLPSGLASKIRKVKQALLGKAKV